MKKTSKIAVLFMAAALTVALATGCSQQKNEQSSNSNQPTSSATVDSLTIAISADENTLTPFTYVHGSPGFDAMSLIYDTLFVRLQQKGCQTPSVAAYAMTPPSWREAFTAFPLRQGPLQEGAGTAKP